jgi:hypothetical protein
MVWIGVEVVQHRSKSQVAKPNLVLKEPGAKHTQEIRFLDRDVTLTFVKVRFVNAQTESGLTVEAKGIRAKIQFLDDSGHAILHNMDGRWDASPNPSTQLSVNDLLPKDFGIEEEQNVDVAFWDPLKQRFIGYNNDSWRYPNLLKPGHDLGKGPITAKIRLVGDAYDKTFDIRFGEEGNMVKILD